MIPQIKGAIAAFIRKILNNISYNLVTETLLMISCIMNEKNVLAETDFFIAGRKNDSESLWCFIRN